MDSPNVSPRAVFDKMMETDYFSQWMGIDLLEIGPGSCTLQMTIRKEMLNGHGILHGGLTFSFADSAFAFASNSHGRLSVSLEASITYNQSANEGDVIIARAAELHLGKKTGTYDIRVEKQDGSLLSLFRGVVYRTSRFVLE